MMRREISVLGLTICTECIRTFVISFVNFSVDSKSIFINKDKEFIRFLSTYSILIRI